ncbi:DUF6950 family protein [Brevundimonas sp. TWP2-3-4b1]|uniref:DUF6950 family protein n=1 Tax=Brevundimonas sp. TWP2-3-4b1 TaxID=2804580 RepID=UPI003CEFF90D
MSPTHPLIRRQLAAQACVERFAGRPYEPGSRDCAKLAAHVLHKLNRKVPFLKGVRWSSEAGGVRALKRLGFDNLLEAVDATGLSRIAPAAALVGDILALPTASSIGALSVAVGNGRVLGFIDGELAATIIQPSDYVAAWSVL